MYGVMYGVRGRVPPMERAERIDPVGNDALFCGRQGRLVATRADSTEQVEIIQISAISLTR